MKPVEVSRHFPAAWRDELINAMSYGWIGPRIAAINRITDAMAVAGLVRAREDTSRASEWQAELEADHPVARARLGARK